ncbi:TRAP transporter substrate-binding protein [Desulfoscipio sp. XC116]|uniref:TRAP transporter substrate-binding protein n=1 Tax=Desulfoscipio sp. XC116 TaxID=3144975 RepID=UPI00325B9827
MKKKAIFWLTCLIISVFALAGCGGGQEPADKKAGDDGKTYTAKLGTVEPVDSPKMEAMKLFKEKVAEATDNKVEITIYPSEQLGSAREMIEATQMGGEEAVILPSSNFTGFEPNMSILDLPFLFPSREVCYEVVDSEVGDALLKTLEDNGLEGVAWWESGFKQLTGSFKIEGPESFKGKKIRVMENPVLISQFQALGAGAIPINFSELYNALQQGVVDGQENPIPSIYEMKFYEVQKYMAISDHGYLPLVVAFNKDWFNALPADYQEAVRTAAKESAVWLRDKQRKMEVEEFIPAMKEAGLTVVELDEQTRQAYADKVKEPTRAKLMNIIDDEGKQLLQQLDEKIAEVSAK